MFKRDCYVSWNLILCRREVSDIFLKLLHMHGIIPFTNFWVISFFFKFNNQLQRCFTNICLSSHSNIEQTFLIFSTNISRFLLESGTGENWAGVIQKNRCEVEVAKTVVTLPNSICKQSLVPFNNPWKKWNTSMFIITYYSLVS